MISGEVGNLLSYGDPLTPTAVVTSVGCIGVVANLAISTLFLKEPFRYRDVLGAAFVVLGVILVTLFAPNNPQELTGEQLNYYLVQWGAIIIYIVYGSGIVYLYFAVQRIGHTHVVWYVLLSSLIGAFTVMSSKPVATFLMLSVEGLSTGQFDDTLELSVTSEPACITSDGFGLGAEWRLLSAGDQARANATHGCVYEGLGQLDQPTFWVAIVVLIVTAVTQVKYLNDALALFPNSEVIPVHYTLFTLCSMTGSIIMYQEYQVRTRGGCTQWWTLHMFIDGIAATFLGVYFITTQRVVINPENAESIQEGLLELEALPLLPGGDQAQQHLDGVKLTLGAAPPPPPQEDEPSPATPKGAHTPGAASTPWSKATSSSDAADSPPAPGPPATVLSGLSRQATRDIVMGEGSGSGSALRRVGAAAADAAAADAAAATTTRRSASSVADLEADPPPARGSRASAVEKRLSFVDNPLGAVAAVLPKGWDARPDNRSSRASNVINFLGALSGGQQAVFMYDPEDKRTKDLAAVRRAAARAEAAEAAQLPLFPSLGLGRASHAHRPRSSSTLADSAGQGSAEMGAAGRGRSQSCPPQSTVTAAPETAPTRGSCHAPAAARLPGIGETGSSLE